MEQYYLIGAMKMLAKVNESARNNGWLIDANTDGVTYELWATKTKTLKKYPLGKFRLSTEQFFCTMAVILNAYMNDSSESMVAKDVFEDYVNYVVDGNTD